MGDSVEQVYRYPRASRVSRDGGGSDLLLSTSGGRTARGQLAHPVFFDGFLTRPEQAAAALLLVAKVARTRFYTPPGMVAAQIWAADPVVTSNGDRLRFESFSACCGVYARYDVLPGGLDGRLLDSGTTNVDVNPPLREALARIDDGDPLHLRVGEDVTVTTLGGQVTERRVPLPDRWIKGFAEVQLASAATRPRFEVPVAQARRLVASLPVASGRQPLWFVPAGRGLRTTSRASAEGVPVSATERLRVLEPLLRFATALRGHAAPYDPTGSTGVWELVFPDGRLVLALSPDSSRGFSGEGGVLRALADEQAAADADLVSVLLAFEPRIDLARLGRESDLDADRVIAALTHLGATGRVGYDVAEAAYFHRELPVDRGRLDGMHPRLRDARDLVAAGAVHLEGDGAVVSSGGTDHVVRRTAEGERCTCPWYSRHREGRGPCKHLLAVSLARAATDPAASGFRPPGAVAGEWTTWPSSSAP